MPTYEYACEKCGRVFEQFQSMKDAPLDICPESVCRRRPWGRGKVRRLIGTGAGVIFKGSGFYTTDYRSDSYRAAARKEKGADSKPAADQPVGSQKAKPTKADKPSKPAAD